MWFKVDDQFATHPKAFRAGNKALGLWVRAGSWCGAQLTDGHVPADVVASLGGTTADAQRLVTAGLWDHHPDGGYQFHEWHQFQPTRAEVLAERESAKQRMRAARAKNNDRSS
jgi:hypothetical protein